MHALYAMIYLFTYKLLICNLSLIVSYITFKIIYYI